MITWTVLAYGAALTALAAGLLVWFVGKERDPGLVALIVVTAVAAVVGWNSILQVTSADQFFTDLPGKVFPISWQDFGSGLFALAAVALILGFGPRRADPARKVMTLAGLAGLGALLVDMYLY